MGQQMTRIFLSHSTQDRRLCEWLRDSAAGVGVSLYLAEHDVRPGEHLAKTITKAIRDSVAVVVLITTNSVNAPYVHQEVGIALEANKVVIPLVQPGIDSSRLAMLQGLKYIEFDFANPQDGRDQLLATLHALIEKQPAAKQIPRETVVMVGLALAVLVLLAADPKAPSVG